MSISGIKPGISASRCSRGAPSGHNLMTLLIKVAGTRELVMVHLGGEAISFPSDREIDTPRAQL
jgi:hypothetical protein